MKLIKKVFLIVLLIMPLQLKSQVHEEWDVRYRGANDNGASAHIVKYDSYGNVYELGDVGFSSGQMLTIKYNNRGDTIWTARKSGTSSSKMSLDNSGNVYVCGQTSLNGGVTGVIIKYSSFGIAQWEVYRLYYINDMVVDDFGNVYITGYGSNGSDGGIQTVKYNSSGIKLWERFLITGSNMTSGYRVMLDNAGNVFTLGKYNSLGTSSIKLLKYDNNGQPQWVGTAPFDIDLEYYGFAGVGIDDYGCIYCAGTYWSQAKRLDFLVTKFNINGENLWCKMYNSEYNLDDKPIDMKVTSKGDVYITGQTFLDTIIHSRVTTIKYDSSGQMKWEKVYTGSGGYVFPGGLALDVLGNVYITVNNSNYSKITTIKYDSTGMQKWLIDYIGATPQSVVKDIEADNYGNIYLCGEVSAVQHIEALTIRYLQSWASNFYITGCVKFKDNNTAVTGGYIKAVNLNRNNGDIITIDSTPIQISGYYSLKHIPSDSVFLLAFPSPNQDFIPTYYPRSIYWRNAQKIFATSNLSEVNLTVDRQFVTPGNCVIKGNIFKVENKNIQSIKDAFIYIMNNNNFVKNTTSNENGFYEINSIQPGTVKVIVDRLGYSSDSLVMTLAAGNTYDNVNFYLNQIYVKITNIESGVPSSYRLYQNYPNPFNSSTKIKFDIPKTGNRIQNSEVKLVIYDITGREISVLINEKLQPGSYEITFNGYNLPSGIYFYQLRAGNYNETKKMILLK